ncbi:MAG TPA: flagellar motor switch protein FliM [Clostridiaceae bacterium]|nr:flagellar motor switch protein FliM [Clostridiaceae bacterium]
MGDIMSQNEIDSLLRALGTGELSVQEIKSAADEKKIRTHDFRRPTKFSKEHLKALRSIHENYARLATNFLTAYLRTIIQIDVVEVESLLYADFMASISNPVVLAIIRFAPLEGNIVFEISTNIAFALIDRILGGKGTPAEEVRDFTEIEIAIIERIVVQMLDLIIESWQDVIQITPVLERIETSTHFAHMVSPNEIVALITFNVKMPDTEGMINICIPYITVEPIISKLSTRYWVSTIEKQADSESKELLEARIEKTYVPITTILGETTITVGEFTELQVGDVLPLDTDVNSDLDILVGDLHKFLGKPGIRKNKMSVKITALIGREDE